jgi:hypothetical protein
MRARPPFIRYGQATVDQLRDLRTRLDPQMYELQPSVVHLWHDADATAVFTTTAGVVVGWLGASSRWVCSATRELTRGDVERAASIVRSCDPTAQEFRHVPASAARSLLADPIASAWITSEPESEWSYVYDVARQVACAGHEFAGLRYERRRFVRLIGDVTVKTTADFASASPNGVLTLEGALAFHDRWLCTRRSVDKSLRSERDVLIKLLDGRAQQHFGPRMLVAIELDGLLVGLAIAEGIGKGWAQTHYQKANVRFPGASQELWWQAMHLMESRGVAYLNFMEDLGEPGLRAFKRRMRPMGHCRQYIVRFPCLG